MSSYSSITINDKNFLKRWIQKRRLHDAIRILDSLQLHRVRVLDYGGGDGELIFRLASRHKHQWSLFEPSPQLRQEATNRLSSISDIAVYSSTQQILSSHFEVIFCCEVLEHLPEEELNSAIAEIYRLLTTNGVAIIGVPIEIYIPAFAKGIFRMARRLGEFDAKLSTIIPAALGFPPKTRPLGEISSGLRYHFHHTGFDHRKLQLRFEKFFDIQSKAFSPLGVGGALMNSELYFVLKKIIVAPQNLPSN